MDKIECLRGKKGINNIKIRERERERERGREREREREREVFQIREFHQNT